jgi:hypothetical protein
MSGSFTNDIASMSVARMHEAFDPGTGLFSRQLRNRRWEPTEGTEAITSTAICLVAASRAGLNPQSLGLDAPRTIGRVFDQCAERYRGGLGLAAWMNAVWDGEPLEALLAARRLTPGVRELDVRSMTTMEASWMLSGLVHEFARTRSAPVGAFAADVRSEILSRYDARRRLFRHASALFPAREWLRRNLANFADQIYAVMALSFDGIARGEKTSGATAADCMNRLIELRGELGQWWWHYDLSTGRVAGRYPVYSVHQHGMAPLALSAVSLWTGRAMASEIAVSLSWLSRNELGVEMVDPAEGTIWREIAPRRSSLDRAVHQARMLLGFPERCAGAGRPLEVNHETRPYEWGWCVHAQSLGTTAPKGSHII